MRAVIVQALLFGMAVASFAMAAVIVARVPG